MMTVVYILLFLLCLSVLVMVHELGHLTAAKIFKVYCFEYSIGFGPKIFRHKRKNGETYFALRAIPFGGYVSMYGEGVEVPEGLEIDPSRSLNHISKWKQAIIMVAGVTMNIILAILIFFISEIACTQYAMYAKQMNVNTDSIASEAGIQDLDVLYTYEDDVMKKNYNSSYVLLIDQNAEITWLNEAEHAEDENTYSVVFDLSSVSSYNARSYNNYMVIAPNGVDDSGNVYPIIANKVSYQSVKDFTFVITTALRDENGKLVKDDAGKYTPVIHPAITLNVTHDSSGSVTSVDSMGLSMYLDVYHNSFATAWQKTWSDFGESSTAIFKGFASLFTDANAFQNLSGPIGIGVATTNILQNFGWGKFLYMWGMISVNLAIINILPFPGLDGWHLLVLLVEGIAHKEIPSKVKNIVSAIGLILLFAFMIAILIKDFIAL